ncbi:MAG: hypothetical protein WCI78_14440 [Mycobacterium sp.]
MLIAGVLCLSAAVASVSFGARSLARRRGGGDIQVALRAMAPAQIAAAVMLGAGGVVALAAAPTRGLVALVIGVVGALGTLAAGAYQSARFAARRQAAAGCGQQCPGCTRLCAPS